MLEDCGCQLLISILLISVLLANSLLWSPTLMPVETNHGPCKSWKVARHCDLDSIEEDLRPREGEMLNFTNHEDDKKYPLCVGELLST